MRCHLILSDIQLDSSTTSLFEKGTIPVIKGHIFEDRSKLTATSVERVDKIISN